jgi:type II secretory pathway pseudopilin PulG
MSKNRKNPENDQRGTVLMELVVAASIIAVVMAAIGFYFVYHIGTVDGGRAQLKLQRVGSLLMEEMARDIRTGRATDLVEDGAFHPALTITYPDTTTWCFSFDSANEDILEGPDETNLSPMEVLDDSYTMGSEIRNHRIKCNPLGFKKEGDRVTIQFTLTHDRGNDDTDDDLSIDFGSAVQLRG